MANSAFRWKVMDNGVTYNAYIANGMYSNYMADYDDPSKENDVIYPIIYNPENGKCSKDGESWEDCAISEVEISTCAAALPLNDDDISGRFGYTHYFNILKEICLIYFDKDVPVGTADNYYDMSTAGCSDMGSYKCPMLMVETNTATTETSVEIVSSGYTESEETGSKEFYYKLRFNIAPGAQGARGLAGEIGPEGPQGKRGSTGSRGAEGRAGNGRNITCFFITDTKEEQPTIKPNTGKYNPSTGEIQYPVTNDDIPWQSGSTGAEDSQFIWSTTANFENSDSTDFILPANGWSDPICLTGSDGADGANGRDGRDGADGAQGEKGAQGPQGAMGAQGEQGPGITPEDISAITEDVEEALGGQIDYALREINGLEGTVSGITTDIDGINLSMISLSGDLNSTQTTVNNQGAQINTLKTTVSGINMSMVEMSAKYVNSIVTSADWKKDNSGNFVDKKWTGTNTSAHYIWYGQGGWMILPDYEKMVDDYGFMDTPIIGVENIETFINSAKYSATTPGEVFKVGICDPHWEFDQNHLYYYVITNIRHGDIKIEYVGKQGSSRLYPYLYGDLSPQNDRAHIYNTNNEWRNIGLDSPEESPLGGYYYIGDYRKLTTSSTIEENERYTIEKLVMEAAVPLVDEISQIYQTSSSITQWVGSQGTVAQIAMGINNAQSSVLIAADHIQLSGDTVANSLSSKLIRSSNWDGSQGTQGFCLDGAQGKLIVRGDGEFSGIVSGGTIVGGSLNINDKAKIDSEGNFSAVDAQINGNVNIGDKNSLTLSDDSGVTLWEMSSDFIVESQVISSTTFSNVLSAITIIDGEIHASWDVNTSLTLGTFSTYKNIKLQNFNTTKNKLTITAKGQAILGEDADFYVNGYSVRFYIQRDGVKQYITNTYSDDISMYYRFGQANFHVFIDPSREWLTFLGDGSGSTSLGVDLEMSFDPVGATSISIQLKLMASQSPITFISSPEFPSVGNKLGGNGLYIDFNDSTNAENTHLKVSKNSDTDLTMEMLIGGKGVRVFKNNSTTGVQLALDGTSTWRSIGTQSIEGATVLKLF